MAEVTLDNVQKVYGGDVHAVKGISIAAADGEFVVLVGPSGCGKSTLLRMIAGLEDITEGAVFIDGTMVNDLEPAERDIAMVFQNYALYPHMTVYRNMAYGLRNRKTPPDEIDRRVRSAAETLQLEEFLERKPKQLSGGQRQRVAMGRAIVREPKVFLFDEPLSNLDAKLRVQMRVEIKKLQRKLGVTSFYVTHDQTEAMTMADRLVVMNGGIAEQIGTPMEVYNRPATTFVAGFIGSPAMNLLPAHVDGRAVAIDGGPTLSLGRNDSIDNEGRPAVVGLRPEHLVADGGEGPIRLSVELVEPLGADTLAHGRLGDTGHALTARLPGAASVEDGETLELGIAPEHIHAFDRASGFRI